jgi:glucose/arabinose dehydrogenase
MIQLLVLASTALALAALPAAGQPQRLRSEKTGIIIETFARGLDHPWGLAFLPDGRMLVTERVGRLHVVSADGQVSPPLAGIPRVHVYEGGLLDVALDPRFSENRLVYMTYGEPCEGRAGTVAGRARLNAAATALEDFQVIFRQQPAVSQENHFGSRLAFAPDGKLFISTGTGATAILLKTFRPTSAS